MKLGILVFLPLMLCGGLTLAQSPESCTQCMCAADSDCKLLGDCPDESDLDGCKLQSFTAGCNGNYTIRIDLQCPGGSNCRHCLACAVLYDMDSGSEIARCHTTCNANECTYVCTNIAALSSGHDYKLYVCLSNCASEETCDDCGQCTARGYVYAGSFATACDNIPACNP